MLSLKFSGVQSFSFALIKSLWSKPKGLHSKSYRQDVVKALRASRVSIIFYGFFIIFFCFFLQTSSYAETGDGGYAGSFFLLGLEGRAVGMGQAFVGVADNAGGALWNPAGTVQLQNRIVGASYRKMFLDRGMGWVCYAQPVKGEAAISVSWINVGVGDVIGRDLEGNPTEEIKNYQNAVFFNFARKIHEKLFLGLNIKYIQYNLADISAYGVGFDFGAMGKPTSDLRIGVCAQNVGMKYSWNSLKYWSKYGEDGTDTKENFPLNFKFGGSYLFFQKRLLLAFELDKNEKQDVRGFFGAEYNMIERIALRAGYNDGALTFGAGIKHSFNKVLFHFDYAYIFSAVEEDPDHIFSMQVKF